MWSWDALPVQLGAQDLIREVNQRMLRLRAALEDLGRSTSARLRPPAGTTAVNTAPLKLTAGDLNTTPESGAVEYDGHAAYLTTAGVRRAITLGNDTMVADVTVANTTTETTVHTSAVAADEFKVGKMYRLTLLGRLSTAAASDFFTMRHKIAGTTILTTAMAAKNVTNEHFRAVLYLTIRTVGASGTYAAQVGGSIGAQVIEVTPVTGSLDTTSAADLTTTIQWDAAKAGNTLTLMQSLLEVVN